MTGDAAINVSVSTPVKCCDRSTAAVEEAITVISEEAANTIAVAAVSDASEDIVEDKIASDVVVAAVAEEIAAEAVTNAIISEAAANTIAVGAVSDAMVAEAVADNVVAEAISDAVIADEDETIKILQ